jgi:hypothetical protein
MDEADALARELEAKVEGQVVHESLRALVGVLERPPHRTLPDLAILGGRVEAAAVVQVARDRVVVVAVDGRDAAVLDHAANLVRARAVADKVAAAVDVVDAELLGPAKHGLERRHVGVDVGDDGDEPVHRGVASRRRSSEGPPGRSVAP